MSVEGKIELSEEVQLAATKRRAQIGTLLSLTLVALLALMWVVLAFSTKSFWTPNNIANLLRQGAMIAILALGETFVVITAGIDLSVGAVVGFTSVIIALLLTNGFPIWAAVIITLLVGIAIGTFHAFGISRLGLPPFIMTLATLTALRGFGLLITNGATISITNDEFTGFSRGNFLGVPNLFWMVIVVAVPALYIFASEPVRSLPLRYWLQYGGGPAFRRQHDSDALHRLYSLGVLCRLRRHSARRAHRHRQCDPGGRMGIAGDRLLRHRRHQPFRRRRLGARAAARFLHPDDDQQRG